MTKISTNFTFLTIPFHLIRLFFIQFKEAFALQYVSSFHIDDVYSLSLHTTGFNSLASVEKFGFAQI